MLFTVDAVTVRVDHRGRVKYARCNRTNRFIKHATAQALLFSERHQGLILMLLAVMLNILAVAVLYFQL